jgi:hypothetical protein
MKTKKKTTRAKKLAKSKQAQVRSKTARAHIAEERETQDPTRKDGVGHPALPFETYKSIGQIKRKEVGDFRETRELPDGGEFSWFVRLRATAMGWPVLLPRRACR